MAKNDKDDVRNEAQKQAEKAFAGFANWTKYVTYAHLRSYWR